MFQPQKKRLICTYQKIIFQQFRFMAYQPNKVNFEYIEHCSVFNALLRGPLSFLIILEQMFVLFSKVAVFQLTSLTALPTFVHQTAMVLRSTGHSQPASRVYVFFYYSCREEDEIYRRAASFRNSEIRPTRVKKLSARPECLLSVDIRS